MGDGQAPVDAMPASAETRTALTDAAPTSELDLLDLPCAGGAGAKEKSEIGAGRHIARAHVHELGHEIGTGG